MSVKRWAWTDASRKIHELERKNPGVAKWYAIVAFIRLRQLEAQFPKTLRKYLAQIRMHEAQK